VALYIGRRRSRGLDFFEGQDIGIIFDPNASAGRIDRTHDEAYGRSAEDSRKEEEEGHPFPFENHMPIVLGLGQKARLAFFGVFINHV
jgi:hypothetical protein